MPLPTTKQPLQPRRGRGHVGARAVDAGGSGRPRQLRRRPWKRPAPSAGPRMPEAPNRSRPPTKRPTGRRPGNERIADPGAVGGASGRRPQPPWRDRMGRPGWRRSSQCDRRSTSRPRISASTSKRLIRNTTRLQSRRTAGSRPRPARGRAGDRVAADGVASLQRRRRLSQSRSSSSLRLDTLAPVHSSASGWSHSAWGATIRIGRIPSCAAPASS